MAMDARRSKLSRHILLAVTRLDQELFHYEAWQVRGIAKRLDPAGGRYRSRDLAESRQLAAQTFPYQ